MVFIAKEDGRVNPELAKVNIGDTAHFICRSFSRPTWYFGEDKELPKNCKVAYLAYNHVSYLIVNNVHEGNEGTYSVYGLGFNRRPFMDFGHLSISSK